MKKPAHYTHGPCAPKWALRPPALTSLTRLRVPFDVGDHDRGDAGRSQRPFDRRAVADDDDREVIEIDVLLRDAQDVVFRDGGDVRAVLLVVVLRQSLRPDRRERPVDAADRSERAG